MKIKNRKIAILTIISSLAICVLAEEVKGNDFDLGRDVPPATVEAFEKVVKEVKEVLGGSNEEPAETSVQTQEPTQTRIMNFEDGKLVSEEVAPAPTKESRQNSSGNNATAPAPEQPAAPNVNPADEPQENTIKQEDAPEVENREQNPTDPSKVSVEKQPTENPDQKKSAVPEEPETVELRDQENKNKIASQDKTEKNDSVDLTKEGDGSQQNSNDQNNKAAPLKREPAWAQNIKEVVVEAGADGVVAYAIYNGIDAVARFGKLIVAVADDEAVEADAQDGALFTTAETAKILISCASAGALRALLGESALAASIKQDGRVTVVVLATLVGNQLIVHGIPCVVASAAANYPKTTIAAGLSVAALAYWCKDVVATWVEKQTATGVTGSNAVLVGACSIAAVSVGVTLATWAYNNYGFQKQK